MHPWEDPDLMPLYHVQLETRDLIVSYHIATDNYDAVEVAKVHLRERLLDPEVHIHKGGTMGLSTVGYHPIGDGSPVVVEWEVVAPGPHLGRNLFLAEDSSLEDHDG